MIFQFLYTYAENNIDIRKAYVLNLNNEIIYEKRRIMRTMKKMSKYLAAVLAIMMCVGLSACGLKFDAAGYTKSALDANYQGKYEEYADFRGISVDEAKKEIEDNKVKLAKQQLVTMGITDDESVNNYLENVKGIEKLAKYDVKESEKQKDGSYIIKIEVQPSNAYQILQENSATVAQEMVAAGKDVSDSSVFMELLIESINRSVAANEYGEAQTVEVKVTKGSGNTYGLEQSEIDKIEEAMFPQS